MERIHFEFTWFSADDSIHEIFLFHQSFLESIILLFRIFFTKSHLNCFRIMQCSLVAVDSLDTASAAVMGCYLFMHYLSYTVAVNYTINVQA